MAEFINLIPDQEVVVQKREKAVKTTSILAIIILLIALGITGYLFYTHDQLSKELQAAEAKIDASRQQIASLTSTEITARNLYKKFTSLQDIYSKRTRYSIVLDEFNKRTSAGIQIEDFAIDSTGKISITGSGDNYLLVAKFMKDLTDTDFPTATQGYSALFKTVTLNTVNLSNAENRASFSLLVDYDVELIKN